MTGTLQLPVMLLHTILLMEKLHTSESVVCEISTVQETDVSSVRLGQTPQDLVALISYCRGTQLLTAGLHLNIRNPCPISAKWTSAGGRKGSTNRHKFQSIILFIAPWKIPVVEDRFTAPIST